MNSATAKHSNVLSCRLPRIRNRKGRCYELAAMGCFVPGPGWVLVHGEVNGPPPTVGRIGHAWLELDGLVYDPVLDQAIGQDVYTAKFSAIPVTRYTSVEAANQIATRGHYGPWCGKTS
jgi:hypothetical protein